MFPAMILSWVFGLILISLIDFSNLAFLWLQLKLILVLLLSFYHFYLGSCLKDLSIDKYTKSSNFFRIINEIPTILLVIIIFVVIYKPL